MGVWGPMIGRVGSCGSQPVVMFGKGLCPCQPGTAVAAHDGAGSRAVSLMKCEGAGEGAAAAHAQLPTAAAATQSV